MICKKCNNEIETGAAFCTWCGAPVQENEQTAACGGQQCLAAGGVRYKTVLEIIKQGLLLTALFALFVFSMFITFNVQWNNGAPNDVASTGKSSFFFFFEIFERLGDYTLSCSAGEKAVINSFTALMTVAVIEAIIVSLVFLALGVYKFVNGIVYKKKFSIAKYAVISAAVYLAAVLFVKAALYGAVDFFVSFAFFGNISVTPQPAVIACIILVACFLAAALILKIIEEPRFVKPVIINVVAVAFVIALIVTVFLPVSKSEGLGKGRLLQSNVFTILIVILRIVARSDGELWSGAESDIAYSVLLFAVATAIFLISVILLIKISKKTQGKTPVSQIVLSGVCTLLSFVYLIAYLICKSKEMSNVIYIGGTTTATICATVFSLLLLAVSIAGYVIGRKNLD